MLHEEKIIIVVQAQQATSPGAVVFDPELDDDGYPTCGDYIQWGEGTEAELIEKARNDIKTHRGGGSDAFYRKAARNVLDYFHEEE